MRQVDHLAGSDLLPNRLLQFDRLADDFRKLTGDLGYGGHLEHLHKTAEKSRPFAEYYDEDSEQLVRNRYAEDFRAFGYPETLDTTGDL